jgi:hypothetical protein
MMTAECPECGAPIVDRFFCGCGLNERAVAAIRNGDNAEPEALRKLKSFLEQELKTRHEDNQQRKSEISELLGRKLEASTSSVGWLKTFHAYWFGIDEPRATVKKLLGKLDDGLNGRLTEKDVASVIVFFLLYPIFVIALAILYLHMAYRYVKWLSPNLAKSHDERAAVALEVPKLDAQIEPLRAAYVAEQERLRSLKERLDKVSEVLETKEPKQEAPDSPACGVPAPASGLLPGFEMRPRQTPSAEEPKPERPRGIFGLIRAAADLMPVRKCPKCRAGLATESDGEEILDTRSWLVGDRPEDDLFTKVPVAEKVIKVAKKSKCKRCGHRWREVSEVGQTVRGACPSCHEGLTGTVVGEEVLETTYRVLGGGPDLIYFHGRTQVKLKAVYVQRRRCRKCSFVWRQRDIRIETLKGVCPTCYGDRKIEILKEKVGSVDAPLKTQSSSVHIDNNFDYAGQTIRQELIIIRTDTWETTYQCRDCSHEWKESSTEERRVF